MTEGEPINLLDFVDAIAGDPVFEVYVDAALARAYRSMSALISMDIWGEGRRRAHVRGYYRRQRRLRRRARRSGM